jgi:Tol biopolymer transport system component
MGKIPRKALLSLSIVLASGVAGNAGTVEVLSLAAPCAPNQPCVTADGPSIFQSRPVSASGRFVAFQSSANNIVPGLTDTNFVLDLYLSDRTTGAAFLVSRSAISPGSTGNAEAEEAAVSANGRYAVFVSAATDLVPGQLDANGARDVFLFDRVTGTTALVSHAAGSPTAAANGSSSGPGINASGRFVVFTSRATDLLTGQVDGNGGDDVFLYDRISGTVSLVSRAGSPATAGNGPSFHPSMSADGSRIAYQSQATDLVPGQDPFDLTDIYLFDPNAGATILVSRASGSGQAGNERSRSPLIGADGTRVAFLSSATDLVAGLTGGDPGFQENIFLHDLSSGVTVLVSHAAGSPNVLAYGSSDSLAIDASGRRIAFHSDAVDLVPGQTSSGRQVFLYDAETEEVTLVSRAAGGGPGTTGNGICEETLSISADGRRVAFSCISSDLVPGQVDLFGTMDVFLYDRISGTTELASRSMASPTQTGSGPNFNDSAGAVLSADGNCVTFLSYAEDLVPGDTNSQVDVFAYCVQ